MLNSNCHTHTVFCDGKNTAEEMIKSAIDKNFVSLGFSVHSPMRINNDWALNPNRVEEYITEIERLKEKYKGKIEIINGIELDEQWYEIDLSRFSYIIGSVHHFCVNGKVYSIDNTKEELEKVVSEEFGGNYNKMAECYFESLTHFVSYNNVDIVGHFDLITKFNDDGSMFNEDDKRYKNAAYNAIDTILERKPYMIFEVNTGAMSRCGNKRPYPAEFILKHLWEMGARITITSDSHSADTIDYAFDEAVRFCKKCGFKHSVIIRENGFDEIEL